MILIFDLDNTLLDIEKFKKDKSSIFGISPEENELQGNMIFKEKGLNYNPEAHIKFLRESGHIKTDAEEEKVKNEFWKLIKNIDKYLFPGVEETLAFLKERGHRLILITLGDPAIQKPKVDNSRIKRYFEKIIYETKDKSQNDFIKQLAGLEDDIIIINDRANQALAMQKTLGKRAKIFLVRGPYSENSEHGEKIHEGITELKKMC